jgi:hypothetical protein
MLQVHLVPGPLAPGVYRLVATVSGWEDDAFPSAELRKLGLRILHGDITATQAVTLTP